MRKILLATTIASLIFAYEGCGENKKEALNNLAQSIYVTVSSNFQKEVTYSKNNFFDFFSKNIKTQTSQSSSITLKNVDFVKKNGLICAEVSPQNLIKSAITAKKEVLNFNMEDLPQDFELKMKQAKKLINKITFVEAVLGDKLTPYEIRKLNNLQKNLNNLLNKSEIVFDVNIPSVKISISGVDKNIYPSKPLILTAGTYSYELNYYGETKNGTVTLKPGMKKVIKVDFLTKKERESLNNSKSLYEKASGLEISYGYGISDNKKWDKEKRITARMFKNYGIYQLGVGLTAGTQEKFNAKAMNEAELFGSFRIQLPEFDNTPLRVGSFLFVPYVGVDGGWDLYEFFRAGLDERYWRGSNITTIVRGNIGFNIMLHKQLGVDFKYSHDFMEKTDNILSAGLIMQF